MCRMEQFQVLSVELRNKLSIGEQSPTGGIGPWHWSGGSSARGFVLVWFSIVRVRVQLLPHGSIKLLFDVL